MLFLGFLVHLELLGSLGSLGSLELLGPLEFLGLLSSFHSLLLKQHLYVAFFPE